MLYAPCFLLPALCDKINKMKRLTSYVLRLTFFWAAVCGRRRALYGAHQLACPVKGGADAVFPSFRRPVPSGAEGKPESSFLSHLRSSIFDLLGPFALCSLLYALCPLSALAATVDQVRGDVRIIPIGATAEDQGRAAAVGAAVNPGETIRVGPDSQVRLALPDGTQVEIFARTQLVFNEDLSDPGARGYLLGLVWGRILSQVVPRKEGGSPYKVITPSTICGVRGTEFIVAVADDGETRIGVGKGEVEVFGTDGTERIPAGMETSVAVGQRPLRPVQALLEKIDWEGWMRERNARFREKFSERVASLTETAKLMDAQLDQLNRRIQKIEADAREFARQRREAVEKGDWTRTGDLQARLQTDLDEGVKVNGLIAEVRNRREVALASGEQALRSVTGEGLKLQGQFRKLALDLETFRASLADKVKADQEVYGRRLQSFRELFQDYSRQAQGLTARPASRGEDRKLLERWNQLSPEKQGELKRKYEEWKGLSEEAREKILANWDRFQKLSQAERREILKNLREFERLSQAEQGQVQQQFERWRALTPEKRDEIRQKFRRFKSLSPEEREAILEKFRNRSQKEK